MTQPYIVESATALDEAAIKTLIRQVKINPFGLKWHQFVVIKGEDGRLLACGQLKQHKSGAVELASIAVVTTHRGKGLARLIIEELIQKRPFDLWLMCREGLVPFYARFGFKRIDDLQKMPQPFRRFHRFYTLIQKFLRPSEGLAIMVR